MSLVTHPPRRRWQRLRRFLGYGAATLVIVAGLCVATLSQLLPWLASDPQSVAQWLSAQAGRPIHVSALQARWEGGGPLFDLEGLSIGEGDQQLAVGRAALRVNAYSGLFPGQSLVSLQLNGLDLTLERDDDGVWQLHGITRAATPFDFTQLEGLGELVIDQANLRIEDSGSAKHWEVPRLDARLRSQSGRLQLAAAAYLTAGAPLRVNVEFDTDSRSGQLFVESEGLDLANLGLSSFLPTQSANGDSSSTESFVSGSLSAKAWIDMADGRVSGAQISLADGTLSIAHEADGEPEVRNLPPLQARFETQPDGWQLSVDAYSGAWLHASQKGGARHIEAADLDIAQLIALLPPASEQLITLSQRLHQADVRGEIELLRADLDANGRLQQLTTRLTNVSAVQVGERPGFTGLSLDVRYADEQAHFDLASPGFALHWPVAMPQALPMALLGDLSLLKIDDDWQLYTDQLVVRGSDFAFDVAGGLRFDGGKPSVDLHVDVFDAPIVAAKRFWLRHRMPANAVQWLDDGLLDGRLSAGRLLMVGDLDDWPFAGNEGRMLAEARVADVTLRYLPDWPVATKLSGTATFLNRSIDVDISAEVLNNTVQRAIGSIASLSDPRLVLDIEGGGSGKNLLALLQKSPMQQKYADSLNALSISGKADVAMQLDIPFVKRLGEFSMRGSATLVDSDLRDARWGIALDAAEGALNFSERGLDAEAIKVLYSGQPADFSIALGSHTNDPNFALTAALDGQLSADTLLDHQPGLSWLKPYMVGTSNWQIKIDMPVNPALPLLTISSDLVGTALSLPPPLMKVASVRMPLKAAVTFPAAQSDAPMALDLRLASLLRLYGNLGDEVAFTGVAAFGDVADVEAPTKGLRVVGQVPVIDATAWATMAAGSTTGEGTVVDVDLYAGELAMFDRGFTETRLQLTRPELGALALRFQGPTIEGNVDVPAASQRGDRGITARFDRLYWPSPRGEDSPITDLLDPAEVPAFHLWVKDLRMGDAELGETRLETFPQGSGMRVDLFESRSPALQLFGRGDWTRTAGSSRSNFELEFTAPELGGMLGALGFSELIEGGQTYATLRASWPGPPAAFAMENVDGGLEISVGQGRVPQVSPGAGRLLGLFSLTEIPRRLSLDFSDFFRSGLAFNKIAGSFVFGGGNAVTDDLLIDSPAAEIRIRGRTGLKAQDYEQTMEVLPRTGSVLPVVGAIAGGPAGAAIGAVAQAVLQSPFKQINRTLYRVDGSWSEPVVEVVERGPAKPEEPKPDEPKPEEPKPEAPKPSP